MLKYCQFMFSVLTSLCFPSITPATLLSDPCDVIIINNKGWKSAHQLRPCAYQSGGCTASIHCCCHAQWAFTVYTRQLQAMPTITGAFFLPAVSSSFALAAQQRPHAPTTLSVQCVVVTTDDNHWSLAHLLPCSWLTQQPVSLCQAVCKGNVKQLRFTGIRGIRALDTIDWLTDWDLATLSAQIGYAFKKYVEVKTLKLMRKLRMLCVGIYAKWKTLQSDLRRGNTSTLDIIREVFNILF